MPKATPKAIPIRDVAVDVYPCRTRATVSWKTHEADFHAWFHPRSFKFSPGGGRDIQVWKRPFGSRDARSLEGASGPTGLMLAAAMEVVNREGLVAKGFAALDAEEEEAKREREEEAREGILRHAGPDLFAALVALVERCDGAEGVRADGSNIDTAAAHGLIESIEERLAAVSEASR